MLHHNEKAAGLRGRPLGVVRWLRLRLRRTAVKVRVEAGTEDPADDAEDSEIRTGLNRDVTVGGIRSLEDNRAATTGVSLHCRILAKAGGNNVLVFWILLRVDHHVVAVVDAAADHAVALHLKKEHFIGGDKPAIDRDEPLTVLGNQRRLTRVNASVKGHGLCAQRGTEAEKIDAARSGGISFDVSFLRERLKQIRDGLRRLDLELLPDVADAGLVRVLGCEVEKVVVYRALELC